MQVGRGEHRSPLSENIHRAILGSAASLSLLLESGAALDAGVVVVWRGGAHRGRVSPPRVAPTQEAEGAAYELL